MTIALKGSYQPSIHRFSLGSGEVTTVLDGSHLRDLINPPFVMDKTEDEILKIAKANRLPIMGFENTYTPTVLSMAGQVVLFDTGFGAMGRDNHAGNLRRRLGVAGYAPEDIDVVAFTHCHTDHIAGVMEGGAPAYPNARYVIGRREFDCWSDGSEIPSQRAQNHEMFLKLISPLAERMTFLEDGDSVISGLTAQAAFGHSLGHMMYFVESEGQSILIWGDVANHFVFSVQYPSSPVGFDDDRHMAIATRKRVLDMVATDGLLVSGHHMPFPSVGYVEYHKDSYRWIPAAYQLRL
ncbi:MAG: MBL fold metallo-hydrolase [Paracoccaceae bacterium]|jgi:glyoxylase-like metal-dependent hydrolase (beta-lactamase superfamily II)